MQCVYANYGECKSKEIQFLGYKEGVHSGIQKAVSHKCVGRIQSFSLGVKIGVGDLMASTSFS